MNSPSNTSDLVHADERANPSLITPLVSPQNLNDQTSEIVQDRSFLGRLLNCKPCKQVTDNQRDKLELAKQNWEDSEANIYWKYKAKEYYAKTQEADKVQEKLDNLSNCVTNVQKDMMVQGKSLRRINDRVVTLEKLMVDSHILLEKIRVSLQNEDNSLPDRQKFIHILSRESPYIYTNEIRFPVSERYIPWRIPFDLYDPTVIVLPKEHNCFKDNERTYVEPNLIKSNRNEDDNEGEATSTTDTFLPPPTPIGQLGTFGALEATIPPIPVDINIPLSDYKWNQVSEVQLPDGKKMLVDRTTWATNPSDKSPLIYRLDTQLLIPLNPMGRTGVRGRGALVRWGPNKSIIAIVTRWKTHREKFAIIDDQQILEALVFKDKNSNEWKLPGGKILGIESAYGAVCRSFNKLAFQDEDSERSLSFQEKDMINHFKSFARSDSSSDSSSDGFEAHMIYRGYIDDVRNTDNAWVEAEIWNFHYGTTMLFPNLRTDGAAVWKDLTNNSRGFQMQTSILREIARLHDAHFE